MAEGNIRAVSEPTPEYFKPACVRASAPEVISKNVTLFLRLSPALNPPAPRPASRLGLNPAAHGLA